MTESNATAAEKLSRRMAQTAAETNGMARVRPARPEDAEAIADILTQAFATLYRMTFGLRGVEENAWLLTALYRQGCLSLEITQVYEKGGQIVGVVILHVGQSIGRGTVGNYWRTLRAQLGFLSAFRAFAGGLLTNAYLKRRIPSAPDLVYIEALAVAETERGKGIGTRLLAETADWAREHGRSRLALHVMAYNTGARRLYERVGFRPEPRQPGEREARIGPNLLFCSLAPPVSDAPTASRNAAM